MSAIKPTPKTTIDNTRALPRNIHALMCAGKMVKCGSILYVQVHQWAEAASRYHDVNIVEVRLKR